MIESGIERLSEKLDEVAAKKIRPQDKIIELIYTHLSMIARQLSEMAICELNFSAIYGWLKVRKNFDEDEIELFRKVYADGKSDGEFDIENVGIGGRYHALLYQRSRGSVHLWSFGSRSNRRDEQTPCRQSGLWCAREK